MVFIFLVDFGDSIFMILLDEFADKFKPCLVCPSKGGGVGGIVPGGREVPSGWVRVLEVLLQVRLVLLHIFLLFALGCFINESLYNGGGSHGCVCYF